MTNYTAIYEKAANMSNTNKVKFIAELVGKMVKMGYPKATAVGMMVPLVMKNEHPMGASGSKPKPVPTPTPTPQPQTSIMNRWT